MRRTSPPIPLSRGGRGGTKMKLPCLLSRQDSLSYVPPLPRGRGGQGVRFLLLLFLASPAFADRVVVGSKNFEESRLLGEIFAQLLESRTDLEVERRLGLAGTQVCFEALKTG